MLTDQEEYKLVEKLAGILEKIQEPLHKQLLYEVGCMYDIISSVAADIITPHMENNEIKRTELAFIMTMLAFQMRDEYGVEGVQEIAKEFTNRFLDALKKSTGKPKLTLIN